MGLHKDAIMNHPRYIYALLLIFSVLYASPAFSEEIYVGGNLEQDEVWTSNNIYIVTQDLKILSNVTLTIEPGVQVRINQNRGIFIYGSLIADGQMDDSISFSANHVSKGLQWKWKGLIYIGVKEIQENIISYTVIEDAEVAIDIYISDYIEVKNTSIQNNQFLGIRLSNSSSINIKNCNIYQNYDGIELASKNADTASNIKIDHCIIKNANHNIYIYKEANSIWAWNTISNNLIEGANNGIWMDNGGGVSMGTNKIERNVIINNGNGAGYGILVSLDSVLVKNNIFWF